MNNEMAINTYLSTTESKKQSKPIRRTETESWILKMLMSIESILTVARWEGGVGEEVRGLKKYNQVVTEQPWGCKVQYRKWSRQRTYTHDPRA